METKYIIIFIIIVLIIFYGGINSHKRIEYNINNFNNIKQYILLKTQLRKNVIDDENIDIENVLSHVKYGIIQNLVGAYFVNLKSHSQYLFKEFNPKTHLQLIFNEEENLDLLVFNSFSKKYYYKLENKISITNIYPLCNNTDKNINLTVFIIKKPFWFHEF